jgi:hypothetical protein
VTGTSTIVSTLIEKEHVLTNSEVTMEKLWSIPYPAAVSIEACIAYDTSINKWFFTEICWF